jgi:hypothetical protein
LFDVGDRFTVARFPAIVAARRVALGADDSIRRVSAIVVTAEFANFPVRASRRVASRRVEASRAFDRSIVARSGRGARSRRAVAPRRRPPSSAVDAIDGSPRRRSGLLYTVFVTSIRASWSYTNIDRIRDFDTSVAVVY